ncbi:MAG: phosphoribosyltransferase family protein [Pseudomonadota bacterium]
MDSFRLGGLVLRDGFRPSLIIAIWRGGTPVGIALQEMMAYCGVDADHIAIRTSSYKGTEKIDGHVRVHGLDYVLSKICHEDSVLIVDDVFDTGKTIVAVIDEMRKQARKNMPDNVRVAVPWFKPARNQTCMVPHYFVRETDDWLVFPHELDSLTPEEFEAHRPVLHRILHPATETR